MRRGGKIRSLVFLSHRIDAALVSSEGAAGVLERLGRILAITRRATDFGTKNELSNL